MNSSETARQRLATALARLESAVAQAEARPQTAPGAVPPAAEAALREEVAALRDERDRLRAALEASESRWSALREATDQVSRRLGVAIDEIESVLSQ